MRQTNIFEFSSATDQIIHFNEERNLTSFNALSEYDMLEEELLELKIAIQTGDIYGIKDALNDLRVIATGALWKMGQDPEASLKETCKEILSREGSIGPDGKWLKNPDQDPSTLYKANYSLSET